jgi:hypothetical protein
VAPTHRRVGFRHRLAIIHVKGHMVQYFGGARVPGPLGLANGTTGIDDPFPVRGPGGRIPGPLGFGHGDPAKGATKATKTLDMPPSTKSGTIMRARAVEWKLAASGPITTDVQQGELANCPVAAILAALAHTAAGQKRINELIIEFTPARVTTTLSKQIVDTLTAKTADDPDYRTQDKQVTSHRYFSVNLFGGIEVSDVFYVKYSDGNDVDMIYMDSPNQALWPCVIEKAYALRVGGYEDLDDDSKHTANEFWEALVGKKPGGFKVDAKTDVDTIAAAARKAGTVPTIAASRDDAKMVLDHHAFAVLGLKNKTTIELYNPHGKTETLSLTDFRANFQTVLYGTP